MNKHSCDRLPPKGTLDLKGEKLVAVIETVRKVFLAFGGEEIVTPICEKRSLLRDGTPKLLYDLEVVPNGEPLTMRYDLTVPLSRYLGRYRIQQGIFFQIGRVFRRDQPSIKQMRLREFWQADFDLVGGNTEQADCTVFLLIAEVFKALRISQYSIRYNYRENIFAMFAEAGVPVEHQAQAVRTLDKLDKINRSGVKDELLKTLSEKCTGKIFELIDAEFLASSLAEKDSVVREFVSASSLTKVVKRDPTLARGLDYYTGIIFEVAVEKCSVSVSGGGRYDSLEPSPWPKVGVSFGISRLLEIATPVVASPVKIGIFRSVDVPLAFQIDVVRVLVTTNLYAIVETTTKNLRKFLKKMSAQKATFTLLLLTLDVVIVKNMNTGFQVEIASSEFVDRLQADKYLDTMF